MQTAETFGPFLLLERIHTGGMSALWLARRAGAERPIALKVVHPRFAEDPMFREMLAEECRIAARIKHDNVLPIVEVGDVDGTPYLALEYVEGATLAQILERQAREGSRLSVPCATAIAHSISLGLHAAHEALGPDGQPLELVHRDVSPSNILISETGRALILDFGVARARGRAIKTSAGTLKGKFAYMPPESITGRAVDRRADIYSLAIVLWECLTGRRYFEAKLEIEVLMMARHPRPTAPSGLRPDVPVALDGVLLEALAPRPADRFATAAEFASALAHALPACLTVTEETLSQLARA